jgi:carboxyl-terminal processing protease
MPSRAKTLLLIVGCSLISVTIGFAGGFAARGLLRGGQTYPLVAEAHEYLRQYFIEDLPPDVELERGMIQGMLQVLGDPYTAYVEPQARELESDTLAGEYGGIGTYVSIDEAGLVHLVPFANGPAARAGVMEGDVLLAIDGQRLGPESTLQDVGAALRGPAGSSVQLLLAPRQEGGVELELTVTRETIALPSATGYLLPDDATIGVIVVSVFSQRTPGEVRAAYDDLTGHGALAIILDLRGNPGGLLDSAVDVARFFLETGIVVFQQERDGTEQVFRVETPGPAIQIPLAVLADGSTASAAEIVAAALQANRRALVVGQPTYGKGSVQLIFNLSDGSSLHITNARWLTPDRQALDRAGLQPDILVDPASSAGSGDPILAAAVQRLQAEREQRP